MNGLYFNIQPQMRIQTANRWTCSNRQNYGEKKLYFFSGDRLRQAAVHSNLEIFCSIILREAAAPSLA